MTQKTMTTPDMWSYRDYDTWKSTDIRGFAVEATDGEIGAIDETSDKTGSNYIVVDTGPWIFGKKVLLPGGVIQRVDTADQRVWVSLSKSEIENAPEFDEFRYHDEAYLSEIGAYYEGLGGPEGSVVERREERLAVDKQTEQAGAVRVGKHVIEDEQSVDVPVTREEVTIQRRKVDRPATEEDLSDASVTVPVMEERVVAGKEARVVEELEIGKTAKTDTKHVTDTVKREEFDVDADDDTLKR
jgi:uncharacterized protein (TIGR02271 family)